MPNDINVNMTPNPLDLQTLHCSQGDTGARKFKIKLHNNGEVIDTSNVKEQVEFPVYKGGTEELLPTNTSTPTTSPIDADIQYPQGLLTDQVFTYRESPTEEDGKAKIKNLYGNTLVWNQQLNDTGSTTTSNGITFTKNADGSITLNGTATAQADYTFGRFDYINGHKYLINGIPSGATVGGYRAFLFSTNETSNRIITATRDDWFTPRIRVSNGVTVSNVVFRLNIFDLTKMGLDYITSVGEFTSLFPSYYSYNQGSLLSFNGNGIKTVGKNKFNLTHDINVTLSGVTFKSNADNSITVNGTATGNATITKLNGVTVPNIKKGESLIWSGGLNRPVEQAYAQIVYKGDETGQIYSFVSVINSQSVLINATESMTLSGVYISCRSGNTFNNETFYPMLRYANTDSTFEPYTSSTTNLPVSTYFPTGMNRVNDVYDELTESKAIKRLGMVDLGTLNWQSTTQNRFLSSGIVSSVAIPSSTSTKANIICSKYVTGTNTEVYNNLPNSIAINASGAVMIFDTNYASYTADTFKSMLIGVYLVYELSEYEETPITTASLVTENGEIALKSKDDYLVGECNSDISENAGFIDAKVKLSDADGENYSNKIQIHVERRP